MCHPYILKFHYLKAGFINEKLLPNEPRPARKVIPPKPKDSTHPFSIVPSTMIRLRPLFV